MRNILQIKVGLRIKDLRAVHDVSQERFANKIGMDRTYLASIEVGQRNGIARLRRWSRRSPPSVRRQGARLLLEERMIGTQTLKL